MIQKMTIDKDQLPSTNPAKGKHKSKSSIDVTMFKQQSNKNQHQNFAPKVCIQGQAEKTRRKCK
jgi:hypothetical protein